MEKHFEEAFEGMGRLSPGSDATSSKAMAFYPEKDGETEILDIGCGKGADTFLMAKMFPKAKITSVDISQSNIRFINERAGEEGLSQRVSGKCMSMDKMSFGGKAFDLMWAQGSIYAIGFREGLRQWKKHLKSGGYIICSEVVWLVEEPSDESLEFWADEYPGIDTIEKKIEQIKEEGYDFVDSFTVPESDWDQGFYRPLKRNIDRMRRKYGWGLDAPETVQIFEREIAFYLRHNKEYGYAFFIMIKS